MAEEEKVLKENKIFSSIKYFINKKFLFNIAVYSITILILMFFVLIGLFVVLGIASAIVGFCYDKLGLTFSDNFYIHICEVISFPFWIVYHPHEMNVLFFK